MAFDATKPAHGTLAKSVEMRSNFLALVIHHRATTAPTGAEEGWIWWDASDPSNERLRAYYDGEWKILFNHMESNPVPETSESADEVAVDDSAWAGPPNDLFSPGDNNAQLCFDRVNDIFQHDYTITGSWVFGANLAMGGNDITGIGALNSVTATELAQLETIGATTISAAQWGYLGELDQGLTQASSPTFAGLTLGGSLAMGGNDITGIGNLNSVLAAELSQLETIGTTTISADQWGYLGALNQALATTDSPTFAGLTMSGNKKVQFNDSSNYIYSNGTDLYLSGGTYVYIYNADLRLGGSLYLNNPEGDALLVLGNNADYSITWSWGNGIMRWDVLSTEDVMTLDGSGNVVLTGTVSGTGMNLSGLTASRLIASDADKNAVSTDLASWVAATDNETSITDEGDGTITVGLAASISGLTSVSATTFSDGTASLTAGAITGLTAVNSVLAAELSQLETIGTTTISAAQWGYLGALDQALTQASSPTFAGATLNGNMLVSSVYQVQFGDSGTYINQAADSHLDINSDQYIDFNLGGSQRAQFSTGALTFTAGTAGTWSIYMVEDETYTWGLVTSFFYDQLVWQMQANHGNFLLLGPADGGTDYDHAAQANPTLFIHAATPLGTSKAHWVGITHDQTDAYYTRGTGVHKFDAALNIPGVTLTGNITMAEDGWIGIGAADTSLVFDGTATQIEVTGADMMFGGAKRAYFEASGTTKGTESIYSAADGYLDVLAGTAITLDANSVNIGVDQGSDILYVSRYSATYSYANIQAGCTDENAGVGLLLKVRDTSGAPQSALYLTSAGNVGIGTTTPGQNLNGGTSDLAAPVVHFKGTASNFVIEGSTRAQILLSDTGAGADEKMFGVKSESGIFTVYSLTDALATGPTAIQILAAGNIQLAPSAAYATYWRDSDIGINSQSDSNVTMFADGSITLDAPIVYVTDGALWVGASDDVQGTIRLLGNGTGAQAGGNALFYTAADYDGTINYYQTRVLQDDLEFCSVTTPKLTYKGGEDRWDFAANAHFLSDTLGAFFGGTSDVSMIYDGTDMNIVTDLVAASDLVIDCGTEKTLELTESVWVDIDVDAGEAQLPASNIPDVVTFTDNNGDDTGIATRGFDIDEYLSYVKEYRHEAKTSGSMYFHVHFQIDDAPSGTDYVNFEIGYTVTRDGATCAPITTITKEIAVDTQYEQYRADFDVVSSAIQAGDQIKWYLKRITAAGDAYAGDAKLVTHGIHVEVDTMGTRQIITK